MLRILHQIFRTGIVTEPFKAEVEARVTLVGEGLEKEVRERFKRSLTIRFVDAGSCNGCELELVAVNNPVYDSERFEETLAVPELGGEVIVRGLLLRDRLALLSSERADYDRVAKVLALAVRDADGEAVFGAEQWEAFGARHLEAALALFQAVLRLSGLGAERDPGN